MIGLEYWALIGAQLRDGSWLDGRYKQSVLHGLARRFDTKHNLAWVGMCRNGQPFGETYSMDGNGIIFMKYRNTFSFNVKS